MLLFDFNWGISTADLEKNALSGSPWTEFSCCQFHIFSSNFHNIHVSVFIQIMIKFGKILELNWLPTVQDEP